MRKVIIFLLLFCVCRANCELNNFRNLKKEDKIHRLEISINKTIDAIVKDKNLHWEQDGIWVLDQANHYLQDETLTHFIQNYKSKFKNHPFSRMLNTDAKKFYLTRQETYGFQKLLRYIISPISEPEELAIKNILEFINLRNQKGYILSHQLIVLIFAEKENLKLPIDISIKKENFINLILQEQKDDTIFSDLFCERVFLLLYYFNNRYKQITTEEIERWIEIILNSQNEKGLYIDPKTQVYEFMGETIYLKGIPSHTTSLCFASISKYFYDLKDRIK